MFVDEAHKNGRDLARKRAKHRGSGRCTGMLPLISTKVLCHAALIRAVLVRAAVCSAADEAPGPDVDAGRGDELQGPGALPFRISLPHLSLTRVLCSAGCASLGGALRDPRARATSCPQSPFMAVSFAPFPCSCNCVSAVRCSAVRCGAVRCGACQCVSVW
jgi:hypothetical protein